MKKLNFLFCFILSGVLCCLFACNKGNEFQSMTNKAQNKSTLLMCGLSSQELLERKETVIASLKEQIRETKELENGYAFKFSGNDEIVDDLTEFIKTERECCSFFIFGISVSGDKNEAWLELTGPEGTKDFIRDELAFI